MKISSYLRQGARETRGASQRLLFFIGCLAIGVAAIVIVASLSQSIGHGVRSQAKELLGADIGVTARQPFAPEVKQILANVEGTQVTFVREQPTVVASAQSDGGPNSKFCELKIVDGEYPYYGSLELQPNQSLEALLRPDTAVVAAEFAKSLALDTGDAIRIGGQPFRIAGIAHAAPDRITGFMYMGPRVYLSAQGFARTVPSPADRP